MTKSRPVWTLLFLLLLAMGLGACTSTRYLQLPEPDMSTPGWELRRGQAVWKPSKNRPEVAGDFFVGVNQRMLSTFSEFNKATIPVLESRTVEGSWEVEYKIRGGYKRTGSDGLDPDVIWLHVPQVVMGGSAPEGWEVTRTPERIIMTHAKRGESLELYIFQQGL